MGYPVGGGGFLGSYIGVILVIFVLLAIIAAPKGFGYGGYVDP